MMPQNPVVGSTILRRPAIQSPNFVTGVSGWNISADGSAEFNDLTIRGTFFGTDFEINAAGAFFYAGTPALGNLVVSVTSTAGTDEFGNTYGAGVSVYDPSGLSAQMAAGILAIANTVDTWTLAPAGAATDELDLTCTSGPLALALTPTLATVSGGPLNVDELLAYGQAAGASVSVTFNSSGTMTVPAGVTTMRRQAWGGSGGGGSGGGAGSPGAEYAEEPASSTVVPGNVITVTIGAAGAAGAAGAFNDGTAGGNTTIVSTGSTTVTAHGSPGGKTSGAAQSGASGSTNTIHHNGGASGASSGSRAGSGGGGAGGTTAAGSPGTDAVSPRTPGTGGPGGTSGGGGGSGGGWGTTNSGGSTGATVGGNGGAPGGGAGAGGYNGVTAGSAKAGGAGAKGKAILTYTPPVTAIVAAVAGLAGTDAGGNAFAAGFTGKIQAFTPGASPTTVETWHAMGAFNANFSHGSPAPAYKLNADNTVSFAGLVSVASGTTSGTVFTLPTAAYFPISTKKWPVPISAGTPATSANVQVTINTSGAIILSAGPTGSAYSFALDTIRYPLDY